MSNYFENVQATVCTLQQRHGPAAEMAILAGVGHAGEMTVARKGANRSTGEREKVFEKNSPVLPFSCLLLQVAAGRRGDAWVVC
jgi:hypothetical protein